MIERIKALRNILNISQNKFSKALGLDGSYFSKIEARNRPINDRIVKLICLTYNVNEKWLRTGAGETFGKPEPAPQTVKRNERERQILEIFSRLTEENQDAILKIASQLPQIYPSDEQSDD